MSTADACGECLRRGGLLGRLSPRIAALLREPRQRPHGLLELSDDDLIAAVAGPGGDGVRRWLDDFDTGRAREAVEARGLEAVCRHSARYPNALEQLPDPPAVLYVAGGIERLAALVREPVVTVVGGRNATPHALEVAGALGRGLAAAGVTVVSGLALGIDAAVHRGALAGATGRWRCSPAAPTCPTRARNAGLYRGVRSRGAVVSELPPGSGPDAVELPGPQPDHGRPRHA